MGVQTVGRWLLDHILGATLLPIKFKESYMFNSKKSNLLDSLLPKSNSKKHTRLKRGLIGAGLGTALIAAVTKRKSKP